MNLRTITRLEVTW